MKSMMRKSALLIGGVFATLVGFAAFGVLPGFAQESASHNEHHASAPPADVLATFKNSIATWNDVREGARDLDHLVATRKLAGVHEAAFNLRDSVRELRSDSKALAPDAQAKLSGIIKQIDTLANELDESGDHNDLHGTVANQRKIHVLLDQIAALYPAGVLTKVGPVIAKGAVKDPVCRMTVDPATAAAQVAYSGQTYYFCSKKEAAAFAQNPAPYAKLYEELAFGKPKTYSIGLHWDGKAVAGQSVPLTFAVREAGSPKVVTKFQLVHEKLMHLIMVSDDLSWFSHEHPQLNPDGRFRLNWTAPRAGRYWLFADFTPADGLNQMLRSEIKIGGGKPRNSPRLVPDKQLSKMVNGFTIALNVAPGLQAGRPSLLTYTITKDGQAVTDMEPYLGAMGHLMAIHQDGRQVVHTHMVGPGSGGSDGLVITPEMATASGPKFTGKLQLPSAGLYKVWAQFQHGGQILTVPFVFAVKPNPSGDTMKTKTSTKTMTALAMSATMIGAAHAAPTKMAPSKNAPKTAPQKVMIMLPDGYKSGAAIVKAGKPVALTFHLTKDAGCGNTVAMPALKWSKSLKVGEKATLTFTPKKSGALSFACGMNMYKGTLVVK